MIEFASLTCGHCAKFHNEVFPLIKENYIDTGKIHFTYNDFPLINMLSKHPLLPDAQVTKNFLVF